jgi:exopolyphosphatase/guanosine-5'-triphosphate,3'-diphosphate pyrophosphatase
MTGDRIAVIDLGSNTFHLLICEINADGTLAFIYKERVYVKLATGGLGFIKPESAERGLIAMKSFAGQIQAYGVQRTRAIGTSALREASNGHDVADQFTLATNIPIEIIDGQKEAGYILKGIKTALPTLDKYGLIMDIGGGSVEFILFKGDSVAFKGSYKIGVAVLHRLFHHTDPISPEEINQLESYLADELVHLIAAVKKLPAYYLIGASGSFEVIQDVLPKISTSTHWSEIDTTSIHSYLNEIISTNMDSRRQIPEIPIERVDYIVVAYILIRYIVRQLPPEKLYFCEFALKEGVLAEMIEINYF